MATSRNMARERPNQLEWLRHNIQKSCNDRNSSICLLKDVLLFIGILLFEYYD